MARKDEKKNMKQQQLDAYRVDDTDKIMTTNQGVKVSEDEFSLKAGERGPTLLEDFHLREKITHFDHERIPERIVHARGVGAYGEFELYESMEAYTRADFLQDPSKKTPIFMRISTVVGSRGSADTVRDVRGMAVKFYTEEGNYDVVGNNMPVFFIQDAIKFPDLVHSIKPEPDTEVPQAAAAHDTFWDFVANNQESAHTVIWAMSPRALPRSLRMMEGFGVHTFRFVNKEGKGTFFKFHLKPMLGVHSTVWDETQKIAGKNPDFHRVDLYEAIDTGNYPEFEVGVQLLKEEDEFSLDFDILDPTKLWPEEDVPVKIIGKITLNRNVDNFFAEVEQAAFCPANIVPGIDFTNDPLLQGRLFSYLDTQLIRLGGPNFHEIPVNRPLHHPHNNQRDGYGRHAINASKTTYHNNSINQNSPRTVSAAEGGFEHYQEKIEARKIRARSESFEDHFSQPAMFYNSMSDFEKKQIIEGFSFELSKVKSVEIRQQVTDMLGNINHQLMKAVADNIGTEYSQAKEVGYKKISKALSQANTIKKPDTLKIGIVIGEGTNEKELATVLETLKKAKTMPLLISNTLKTLTGLDGKKLQPDHTFTSTDPVLIDALFVPNCKAFEGKFKLETKRYLTDLFTHFKPIMISKDCLSLMNKGCEKEPGVLVYSGKEEATFVEQITEKRFWERDITKW